MEVSNRFDLLASLSIVEESNETISVDVEVVQDVVQPTRSMWDVPDYVEKVIPCVIPIVEKETVTNVKKSRPKKKVQETIVEDNQQEIESELDPIVEVKQTVIQTACPPQPYKFKPALSSEY